MLITNFSSGELSKYLYGRVDLGQYYQAGSKVENFDYLGNNVYQVTTHNSIYVIKVN